MASTSGIGAVGSQSIAGALGNDNGMGREEFLKLLVAQLKNQDPLKPQDNAAFVAELAQFSSLEQAMGINERLDLLATQNQGLANSQVIGLVGNQATVRGSIVTSDGTGFGTPISFTLSAPSDETVVTIRNQAGQAIRTFDIGAKAAGIANLRWDGKNDAGVIQPAGSYVVSVAAKDSGGSPVSVNQESTSVVDAVSFDKGYPVLHLQNGVSVPVSDLLRVKSPPNN